VPFFGICLGMQVAVIEFARNVSGLRGANSTEFDPTPPYPVVDLMPEQRSVTEKGATMRLGAYPCVLAPGSKAAAAYGASEISERHRHRYEVNNDFREALTSHGMLISGASPDRRLVEMIELPQHPYFVGCQFHSRVQIASPGSSPAVPVVHRVALRARLRTAGARRGAALAQP
jgi:CTP synthase